MDTVSPHPAQSYKTTKIKMIYENWKACIRKAGNLRSQKTAKENTWAQIKQDNLKDKLQMDHEHPWKDGLSQPWKTWSEIAGWGSWFCVVLQTNLYTYSKGLWAVISWDPIWNISYSIQTCKQ